MLGFYRGLSASVKNDGRNSSRADLQELLPKSWNKRGEKGGDHTFSLCYWRFRTIKTQNKWGKKDTAILQGEHINPVIPDDPISAQGRQKSPNLDLPSLYCAHSCLFGQAGFEVNDNTNKAARASNWKCSISTLPLQALLCPACSMVSHLLEATAGQGTGQILHFKSTLCSQHTSRRKHLQALPWAHCQLGQGQHVDTKELEKGGDAEPAQLNCKVHTGNLDTTEKIKQLLYCIY